MEQQEENRRITKAKKEACQTKWKNNEKERREQIGSSATRQEREEIKKEESKGMGKEMSEGR